MMSAKGAPATAAHPRAANLRAVSRLISAYWRSAERWAARGLLILVIALDFLLVYRAVLITYWQKDFYDTLAAHDLAAFCSCWGNWRCLRSWACWSRRGVRIPCNRWKCDGEAG